MSDLANRILKQIVKASSKRPARAADVAALVGGAEAEFWAELEGLVARALVAWALIQRPARDPEPWLAIWPTGVIAKPAPLSGNSLRGLFVRHAPMAVALRQASAPRSRQGARP